MTNLGGTARTPSRPNCGREGVVCFYVIASKTTAKRNRCSKRKKQSGIKYVIMYRQRDRSPNGAKEPVCEYGSDYLWFDVWWPIGPRLVEYEQNR